MSWTVRGLSPSGGEIFCAVQTICEAHPAPFAMGTGSFPGKNSRSVMLTIHLLLVSACDLVGSVPTPPLCIRIGISWGDLYLYSHITTLNLHYYCYCYCTNIYNLSPAYR
jgi:hypothetical protein